MLFNSLHFVAFFAVVLPLTLLLRKRLAARNTLLLIASYYFYGWWDWRFLGLLMLTTGLDYTCARLIDRDGGQRDTPPVRGRRERLILIASLSANIAVLGTFKYANFFIDSAAAMLAGLGFHPNVPTLRIILPVGISFYTLQSMSYVIDVYRGMLPAEKNLRDFALYVAFFPQLVAGPIERATNLLPQIKRPVSVTWPGFYSGFYLICWGLFKKVALADNVAGVVDQIFGHPNPSGAAVLVALYGFSIQLYCDFSGYSDIAQGTARCMGFELMRNFDLPYIAVNIGDFWRRWHISLSSWVRDYIYFPLGGSRRGEFRTNLNLVVTMTIMGLWHGAAWTWLMWGTVHGILLCIYRSSRGWFERNINPQGRVAAGLWFAVRVAFTFHVVCFVRLLNRSQDLAQLKRMAVALLGAAGRVLRPDRIDLATVAACGLIVAVAHLAQYLKKDAYVIFRLPAPARAVVYASFILGFIAFGEYYGEAFIYFQF